MSIPFMLIPAGVRIICGGKSFTVTQEHINYENIINALKDGSSEKDLLDLVDLSKKVLSKKFGTKESYFVFDEKDEQKLFIKLSGSSKLFEVPAILAKRVSSVIKKDLPFENYLNFTRKLFASGSKTVVSALPEFLDKFTIPILEDGDFYAYIKVAYDYFDFAGNFSCKPGQFISLERFEVDDDRSNERSSGLWVCPLDEIDNFFIVDNDDEEKNPFERVMRVKVNPAHVVTIPSDEDNNLLRTSGYMVVDEVPNDFSEEILKWSYGTHSKEWALKTFEKVINFFKLFYENKRIVKFDWLPDEVITDKEINASLVDSFIKKAKEQFPEITPIGNLTSENIDKALGAAVDSPQSLMEILSQVSHE